MKINCRCFIIKLVKDVKFVLVVDFVDKFIDKNKKNIVDFINVDYKCVDVI